MAYVTKEARLFEKNGFKLCDYFFTSTDLNKYAFLITLLHEIAHLAIPLYQKTVTGIARLINNVAAKNT